MTQPLTPPSFGSMGYNVPLTDIGQGYAAGITSAGNSIAGAIGAVMGGINQRTGEAQEGILSQKKSSEQTLEMLHTHGMIDDATYEKAMTSNLGAQQKIIGISTAEFNTRLQAEIEQKNRMAQIAAQEQGAYRRQQLSSGTTLEAERERIKAEQQKQQPGKVLQQKAPITPQETTRIPSFLPQTNNPQAQPLLQPKLFP